MPNLNRTLLAEFFVEGRPVPQSRPRVVTKGGKSWAFSDRSPALRDWKRRIAFVAKDAYKGEPATGAVELLVCFLMSAPKKGGEGYHVKRPDLDNLLKAGKDALSGIVWIDDSQVSLTTAVKRYRRDGEESGVQVKVWRIGYEDKI